MSNSTQSALIQHTTPKGHKPELLSVPESVTGNNKKPPRPAAWLRNPPGIVVVFSEPLLSKYLYADRPGGNFQKRSETCSPCRDKFAKYYAP